MGISIYFHVKICDRRVLLLLLLYIARHPKDHWTNFDWHVYIRATKWAA